jgi:hypothetical protein
VRTYLASCGAVAGASILALGLVVVPPDVGVRAEVRAVQITAIRLQAAQFDALQNFLANHAQAIRHVSEAAGGGAADVPAAVLKTPDVGDSKPATVDPSTGPAIANQGVQAAVLAEPAAAVSILDPILGIVSPFLALLNPGVLLLFGPIILLVVLACPPCAVFNFVTGIISSFLVDLAPVPAVAAAATTMAAETVNTDTTMTDGPVPKEVSVTADTTNPSADAPSGPKAKKSDESVKESATENEQTSTETTTSPKEPTETAKADEAGPPAANAADPSDSSAGSEEAKPTPRPVVRRSLDAGDESSEPSHPGNGHPTAKHSASDHETSSAARSSAGSTDGNSSGSDSSGGDSSST